MIFVVAVGTPEVQLADVFQLVDEFPVQVEALIVSPITKSPKLVTDNAWMDVGSGDATECRFQVEADTLLTLNAVVVEPASTSAATQLKLIEAVVKAIPLFAKLKYLFTFFKVFTPEFAISGCSPSKALTVRLPTEEVEANVTVDGV